MYNYMFTVLSLLERNHLTNTNDQLVASSALAILNTAAMRLLLLLLVVQLFGVVPFAVGQLLCSLRALLPNTEWTPVAETVELLSIATLVQSDIVSHVKYRLRLRLVRLRRRGRRCGRVQIGRRRHGNLRDRLQMVIVRLLEEKIGREKMNTGICGRRHGVHYGRHRWLLRHL